MASKNIRSTNNLKQDNVNRQTTQDGVINIAYLRDSNSPELPKSTRTAPSIHAARM